MPSLRLTAPAFLPLLLAALAALFVAPASAGPVEPPLELLFAPDNRLVAGELLEVNPPARLVFSRREVLSGQDDVPERVDVRAPEAAVRSARVGEAYLFGYTRLRKDPRGPEREMVDKEGARLLDSIGLEPALFHDTPAARAILAQASTRDGRESRKLLVLLLDALAGDDPSLQVLAAGQLAQDPEIAERLRRGDRAAIEAAARDAATPAGVRRTLLMAAWRRPEALGDWWKAAALDMVTTTPAGGYAGAATDPSGLALAALELLDARRIPVPAEALQRWVRSGEPLLVERAGSMLRRESPALERKAIGEALADPALPAAKRKFLNDHLRRLERHDGGTKAPKDGTGRS